MEWTNGKCHFNFPIKHLQKCLFAHKMKTFDIKRETQYLWLKFATTRFYFHILEFFVTFLHNNLADLIYKLRVKSRSSVEYVCGLWTWTFFISSWNSRETSLRSQRPIFVAWISDVTRHEILVSFSMRDGLRIFTETTCESISFNVF